MSTQQIISIKHDMSTTTIIIRMLINGITARLQQLINYDSSTTSAQQPPLIRPKPAGILSKIKANTTVCEAKY
jgi:hypothetical protein